MKYEINKVDGEYVLAESNREDAYNSKEEGLEAIERVKSARSFTIGGAVLKDKSQEHVKAGRSKANKKLTKELKRGR